MEVTRTNSSHAHAITELLTSYVNGEIRDTAWNRFMNCMDSQEIEKSERRALAAFFQDALDEIGDGDIYIPMLDEATTIVDDSNALAA